MSPSIDVAESETSQKPAIARNVQNVVLGDVLFKTWYPSFYPEELVGKDVERLYVCRWCFKYCKDLAPYIAHKNLCPAKQEDPPGRIIYEKDPYWIYEVDGEEDKACARLFTQNLSLFAKLFLDNKSVFYDVSSFNYYLLVYDKVSSTTDEDPGPANSQIVGFFSKEKMSWDNNNLACILVFPPWQRRGLGKILMAASYELSKREGRIGGPEKPLSELGKKGYMRFWESRVTKAILKLRAKHSISIRDIALECWMLDEDVVSVLKEMDLIEPRKKGNAKSMLRKEKLREWATTQVVDLESPVDYDAFVQESSPEPMED
ncbi:MAG: hypothetical protein MMC33_009861 [Icmadophila ericetorum]|nr:hypothetical protein [Icmadophila ericetorum]